MKVKDVETRKENIEFNNLVKLSKYDTTYFDNNNKEICRKFLEDGIVTIELLELYCYCQVESWGDMVRAGDKFGIIEFIYEDIVIYGKYTSGDYPARISFDINELNNHTTYED